MNTLMILLSVVVLICAALLICYFAYYRRKYVPIKHTEYYEDKSVCRTYITINGVMNGQEITYYPNKQVKSEVMWVNGEKTGPYVE